MRCLHRGVCTWVFVLGCPWPGWPQVGVMSTVHKSPTPPLQMQQGVRVSVPLLHLTRVSSSPRRQNCTSLLSLQKNNLFLPLLSCYNPSSLSSFSFTPFTGHMQTACSPKFTFCYLSPLHNVNCPN